MAEAAASDRPDRGEGREALLRAVVRVVARSGFAGLTYRAVAKEAGVTHGLVTYHFGSRDAMVHEALAWAASDAIRDSHIQVADGGLPEFAESLAELVATEPDAQAFQFELALEARRRPALRPEVRALYENYFGVIERSLEALDLSDDPVLARLVFAALDGIVLQQLIFGDGEATDASLERLRSILELVRASRAR